MFLYRLEILCTAIANFSSSVNELSGGVRVSGGHLYEIEAPTEAVAETSLANPHCSSDFFGYYNTTKVVDSSHFASCGARLCAHCHRGAIVDRGASLRSLHHPQGALATSPVAFIYTFLLNLQIVLFLSVF